jgi:hypothetical protein
MSTIERTYPIVLNSSNLVANGRNDTFKYNFPSGATFKNAFVSIMQINMYNSIFNINGSLYNNNSFSIIFPTASTTYTLNVTLPNSYMAYSDINSYVQSLMIAQGLYLINGSTNVYFWNIQANPTLYSAQINEFSVPTIVGTYTRPSSGVYSLGGTGLPTTAYTPQTVIPNTNFTTLVGLNAGTYPSSQQTTTYSVSSTFTPQISPVQSLNVHCSLVNSKYTSPPDYLGNFNPNNVSFGLLCQYQPTNYQYLSIQNQTTGQVTIYFTDQNNNIVYINDPTTTISLLIKEIVSV